MPPIDPQTAEQVADAIAEQCADLAMTEDTTSLPALRRIERFVDSFFLHRDLSGIDRHELAMKLWDDERSRPVEFSRSILRLRCLSALRSATHPLPEPTPIASADISALRDEINRLTAALTPAEMHLLYLRFWRGLTISQIALSVDRSERTVRSSLDAILHRLRLAAERTSDANER